MIAINKTRIAEQTIIPINKKINTHAVKNKNLHSDSPRQSLFMQHPWHLFSHSNDSFEEQNLHKTNIKIKNLYISFIIYKNL